MKKTIITMLVATLFSSYASADLHRASNGRVINTNSNKVVVAPQRNNVVVSPRRNNVIVAPKKHHKDVVVVNNKKHHHDDIIVVKPRPHYVPHWRGWHGGSVVVVDNHHHDYYAFKAAMVFLSMAIVVDQSNDKPYTEEGKEVVVKERHCDDDADKGKTEVIDLDDQVILLVCK